jgi:hypothetical protein
VKVDELISALRLFGWEIRKRNPYEKPRMFPESAISACLGREMPCTVGRAIIWIVYDGSRFGVEWEGPVRRYSWGPGYHDNYPRRLRRSDMGVKKYMPSGRRNNLNQILHQVELWTHNLIERMTWAPELPE